MTLGGSEGTVFLFAFPSFPNFATISLYSALATGLCL